MKEMELLIKQLSLQLSRLDKMICQSTFSDDQLICLIGVSIFVISEVFEGSSFCFFVFLFFFFHLYVIQNLHIAELTLDSFT